MEEYAKRELMAMPVQHYLFKYVLPTVHDGLLQCARLMPGDPVNFLAEYLLQKCKPSDWSGLDRFFDRRPSGADKNTETGPNAGKTSMDASAASGDAPTTTATTAAEEAEQFLIAETAYMFADFSDRLSQLNFDLVTDRAHISPEWTESEWTESLYNAAIAVEAAELPSGVETALTTPNVVQVAPSTENKV